MLNQSCKLCQRSAAVRHVIKDIPYYFCEHCHLLQNFYWDNRPAAPSEQIHVNATRRHELWPAGDRQYMYELGWRYLELLVWPIAWQSRRLHQLLSRLPQYRALVRRQVRRRLRRVLDFGCGHGISVLELRQRENIDAIGLDPYSPTEHPAILRVPLAAASLPDNSFDGIFSVETLEHVSDILETFRHLHRVLKPGGVLLIQTNRLEHPDYALQKDKWFYLSDPQTHVSIYSEPALRVIARQIGFSSVEFHGPRLARLTK